MMARLMESHCLSFAEIPHSTPLFLAYVYHYARVSAFYRYDPFDPASFRAAAGQVELEPGRRRQVAQVLAEQCQRFGAGPQSEENIARLRDAETVAVVTGQQTGLFGGPAYSIYKALTAVHLAEKLTREGTPAVPVFWLASEDHDFQEVNHTLFLDNGGRCLALHDSSSPHEGAPVGQIAFSPSIDALRQRAVRLWPAEARSEAESLLSGYAPGANYADAFGRLLQRLLSARGLIVLDPAHPTLHALSRPLFRRALEQAEGLRARLRVRDRELSRAGYHAQVRLRDNATLLFLNLNGRRSPLRRRSQGFFLPGPGERSLASLLEELEDTPERFSANALLRPLIQDFLLPTVAYVAGPAEVAYYAQA
ncbi:MAG: bacillithiol biosynthesis cysteine-adding enzyme BshC, partial [Terriglobia bacterium]